MRIGIIGSGTVAQTVGGKLLELGHEVMISSRDLGAAKDSGWGTKLPSVNQWVKEQKGKGRKAHGGSFADAARFGEVVMNATHGVSSVEALTKAGAANLRGKVLVDIANPLDFSRGTPPSLAFSNTDSLGERIQGAFPDTKVVKALNTVNASVMVSPALVPGDHVMLIAGNDAEAKRWVTEKLLMEWFGWKRVIDLGDITNARATEMYLPLWIRLMNTLGTPMFNIGIMR